MSGDGRGGGAASEWLLTTRDELFTELWAECSYGSPQARLSSRLRARLERIEPEARSALVSRMREGSAPLLQAARRGALELMGYLLHVCHAPLEQRGYYTVEGGRAHLVTPLWAAAVAGQLDVVRALHAAGAQLDAPSDSGSTPLRSACFMTHEAVVRYLVQAGADVCRPNHSGGTCLINTVQSPALCRLLLEHGAPVNAADIQGKTALIYAVQERLLETMVLLLEAGADPRMRTVCGLNALLVAAMRGGAVLALMLAHGSWSPRERADALLLAGGTALDDHEDAAVAAAYWRQALRVEGAGEVERGEAPPELAPHEELRREEELEALQLDPNAMRAQALLIAHRVLGPAQNHTLYRIVYRGSTYADEMRYDCCVSLWRWALRVRISRDTLLHSETSNLLSAFTRLLEDTRAASRDTVLELAHELLDHLIEVAPLVSVRPASSSQCGSFDRSLRCLTHLLHVALDPAPAPSLAPDDQQRVMELARRMVGAQLVTATTGDSLLHLAATRLNVLRESERSSPVLFPSTLVTAALCAAGCSARARNLARCTPLHVAALPYNFSNELMETLLAAGGHLDTPNRFGESGASLIARLPHSQVCRVRHTSLQCAAALVVLRAQPDVRAYWPHLHHVLELHTP